MDKNFLSIISTSHFATINLSHNEDNVLLAIIIIYSDLKKKVYLTDFVNDLKVTEMCTECTQTP